MLKASNVEAKEILVGRKQGIVTWTKRRPNDVRTVKFLLHLMLLGIFGAHNFVIGRKRRGWIILTFMLIYIASIFIFPPRYDLAGEAGVSWRFAWRNEFASWGWIWPLDVFGLIALGVWFVDWFAIVVFQNYKYPVHIPPPVKEEEKPKEPEKRNRTIDQINKEKKKKNTSRSGGTKSKNGTWSNKSNSNVKSGSRKK